MSGEDVPATAAFGQLLRRCRQASGLTQEELAERAGIGVRTIRDLERGQRKRPFRQTIGSLAEALDLGEQEREKLVELARHGWRQIPQDGLKITGELSHEQLDTKTVPRQLPAAVSHFTGRAAELQALTGFLDGRGTSAVVICALAGAAGVGKTAVAVHWAHQVAERFPDGQLYADLRGYDPGPPVTGGAVLGRFLRALGMPNSDIPAEEQERAACYRSTLAGHRMLVVLDNAVDADQVRPLLPGTQGSVAVVTSRDALAGLVARDGASRLELDVLPVSGAVGLLRALIGARVDAEPEAAAAIAAHTCRLPLALRVAAELAAARPTASLASLAAELADQQRRLDLLAAGGDARTAVRAVFSWSLRHMDPGVVRAFRLIGIHPGPDLDSRAAAALTGYSAGQVGHVLGALSRAHLIHNPLPGRYAMHDLLRDFARELGVADGGAEEQRAALTRLFDQYLDSAGVAMRTLFPAENGLRPGLPEPPPANTAWLKEEDAAKAWLAAELPSLVAAVVHAAAHGWPDHAISLAATVFRYLDPIGHLPEAVTVHESATSAARQVGDVAAQARALTNLAAAELRQRRDQEAAAHLLEARTLSHQAGDRVGEARALGNLGVLAFWQGRYAQAAAYYEQALHLHRQTGNRTGEITSLCNLAGARIQLSQYGEASARLRTALVASREIGHRDGAAYALVNLGDLSLRQKQYEKVGPYLEEGLALCRQLGDRAGEAAALSGLGELALRQRHYETAARHLHLALDLSREAGARSSETDALHLLDELSRATGNHRQARMDHVEALPPTTLSGDARLQVHAEEALDHAHHADPVG